MQDTIKPSIQRVPPKRKRKIRRNEIELIIYASIGVSFLVIFAYIPMFGLVLAFKDGDMKLNILQVITRGEWIGFKNFGYVFSDYSFKDVFVNTISLNLLMLLINFPAPVLFALFLNEIKNKKFRTIVQSVAIFPTFISWMIFGGIFISLTDVNTGIINPILEWLGLSSASDPVNLGGPQYFWAIIITTSLIKGTGWGSIIYTAAIAGINQEMYEAATIDGANRWQVMFKITLPAITPTILIFFLLSIGGLLGNNFEQFYVFQNAINLSSGEVLATYSYKYGIAYQRYSFATALGLIQSIISLMLLVGANAIAKKFAGRGLY